MYGPFSAQDDGFPNAGEVVQFYREQVKMSRARMAQLLNTSRRWITKMEKENAVSEMISRRRVLAQILSIPPILLGIGIVGEDNFLSQMGAHPVGVSTHLDGFVEYLDNAWSLSFAAGGTSMVPSTLQRAEKLKTVVAYGGTDAKKALVILNSYEQFLLVVGREQGSNFNEEAVVDTALETGDREAAAKADALRGLSYARKSGPQVHGWGLSIAAQVLAAMAKDAADVRKVLDLLDEARGMLDSAEPDIYRLNFTKERYPIIRAEALTPLLRVDPTKVDEVFAALDEAEKIVKPQFLRRKAHLELTYAQAAFYAKDHLGAVSAASSALELSRAIGSRRNERAIVLMYTGLQDKIGGTAEHKALGRLLTSTK